MESKPTTPKSEASLYRLAAKHVAQVMYKHDPSEKPQHKACCTAIHDVGEDRAYALVRKFEDFFKPPYATSFWFGTPEDADNRPVRVLALCFMAAMVEAGDA